MAARRGAESADREQFSMSSINHKDDAVHVTLS